MSFIWLVDFFGWIVDLKNYLTLHRHRYVHHQNCRYYFYYCFCHYYCDYY